MTTDLAAALANDAHYLLTEEDFQEISKIVADETGIALSKSKQSLVYARLTKRLRALRLQDFCDYVDLLRSPSAQDEMVHLVEAITTNVTSFYREGHHFDHFRQIILPRLAQTAQNGARVRIWSAACSSGEEPYTIALCVEDVLKNAANMDFRILATDIDGSVLSRANSGKYSLEALASLPSDLRAMIPTDGRDTSTQIPERVADLVRFRQLNLMKEWPFQGAFDVIFCRNAAIYFDKATQERLWQRLADRLLPGGTIYIGHSERIDGPALNDLSASGVTQYVKKSALQQKDQPPRLESN